MSYIVTILVTLKLVDYIDWPWWLIGLPVIGPLVIMGLSIIMVVVGISIAEKYHQIRKLL
jgi:hypothetical protein